MLFLLSLFPAIFGVFDPQDDGEEGENIFGTLEDDNLTGTPGNDDMNGLLGNDTLDGGAGNDVIQGKNGDDLIIGGEGNDALQGRGDNDTVQGFSGEDWVDGNDGDDVVRGGVGNDVVIGGQGADEVFGRNDDDVLFGGEFLSDPLSTEQLDAIRNGTSFEELFGENARQPLANLRDDGAADTLDGGNGNDVISIGAGDQAFGGAGQDYFDVMADQAEGGPALISDFNASEFDLVSIYLRADEVFDRDAILVEDDGEDALVSYGGEVLARVTGAAGLTADDIGVFQIEDPTIVTEGTDNADTIIGTLAEDDINGNGGNDDIVGGSGDDTIDGGDGADVIQGQAGFDRINGNADDDVIQGRGGNDSVSGNRGDDWVDGNDGDDLVNGGLNADTLIGGLGADLISGGEGNDYIVGGELFAEPLTTQEMNAIRDGVPLNDVVEQDLSFSFAAVDDNAADTLDGGNGADLFVMGAGDTATGGAGSDSFGVIAEPGQDGIALITDFNSEEDEVRLFYEDAGTTSFEVTVTADEGDALVLLDGTVVARVTGAATTLTADGVDVFSGLFVPAFDPNA